jgi:16S rRNA (uracil1498-N3)-methyltransferase
LKTFYLPPEEWREPYALEGQEAKHLVKVLRARAGDLIRLLDGRGREGTFRITATEKQRVSLNLEVLVEHPAPSGSTVLALGWAKSVRRGWLLEKAVELEAGGVWLWQADRSQSHVPEDIKESWEGQMIAGAKQSVNPWLPELRTIPEGVEGLVALAPEFDRTLILWEGQSPSALLSPAMLGGNGRTLFVVGPEGGFSDREVRVLTEGGFTPVSLGRRILRWETAALLCLGLDWWHRELNASSPAENGGRP